MYPRYPAESVNVIYVWAAVEVTFITLPFVLLMCRGDVGLFVPIPTLPDPVTNRILEDDGESILNKLVDDAPEICNLAEGEVDPTPIPKSPFTEYR